MADRINLAQIALWLAWVLWLLPTRGHFLFDEAYFFDQSFRVLNDPMFPVFGPFISGTDPQAYTPGGALYLLIAPIFAVADDPRWGTAWILVLGALGTWLLDRAMAARQYSTLGRIAAVTLLCWSPWHAWLSDRIWNVHLYWFLTPALFALTIRNLGQKRIKPLHAMLFGAFAAAILQVHIGGVLAIAGCLLALIVNNPHRFKLKGLGLAWMTLAGLAVYAPYIITDMQHGFANLSNMRGGVPNRERNMIAVEKGLRAILLYTSHFRNGNDALPRLGDLMYWVKLGALPMTLMSLYGLSRRHALRPKIIGLMILTPLYFFVIRRSYFDHYVASIVPLLLLAPALGLKALVARHPKARSLAYAGLLLFAVTGVTVTMHDYLYSKRSTVDGWLATTDRLLAAGKPVATAMDQEHKTEMFIYWVLAHNVRQQNLTFALAGRKEPCTIEIEPTPQVGRTIVALQGQAAFVCPEER